MYFTKNKTPAFLVALLLLILCIPMMALAESVDIQEITVPNRPIKGLIQVQKQGPVLTGFNEHQDPFGNTVHTPMYNKGSLAGTVFEVRAVEDIVGKDGTLWFKADEVAATITTNAEGVAETKLLPLGHYYVTEVSAPAGYIFDSTRYDVLLEARDHETPTVSISIIASNDYMPTRITLHKEKEVLTTETDKDGITHTTLTNVPGEGFVFGLYNREPIAYTAGTLDADTLLATAVSDKNGKISFGGQFPQGPYYVRELSGPEGWKLSEADFLLSISEEFKTAKNEIVIDLDAPIVNELVHKDVRVSKTDLTGSDYLPHTLIEVKSANGKTVLRDYTGDDGYLPSFPAVPGKYTYREVLAPEGYELCVTELAFSINQHGEIEGKATVADDYTRFSILKVDEYHKPLAGVEFGLFREDGAQQASRIAEDQGLADFRIRARMIQLGHIEAKGALNYVSRERIQPFAFNPDAWKENELSYVVDPWTVERLQKENKDFQAFMISGDYVYADGHVVLNDPKFVEEKGGRLFLTNEARKQVDACCLRFTRQYVQKNIGLYVYGRMFYDPEYVAQTKFYLSDMINERRLDELDARIAYRDEFPRTFVGAFDMLMKKNGQTRESVAPLLHTTERSLHDWLYNPDRKITRDFIVYITLMWKVPDWISSLLLKTAGLTMNEYDRRHQALEYVRTVLWDQGIEKGNKYMTSKGLEPLSV